MTIQQPLFDPNLPAQLYLFDTIPGIDPGPLPDPVPGWTPGLDPDPDPDYDPDIDPDPELPPGPESPGADPGFPGNIFPEPAPVT
jgi:hypothetical protein